MTPDSPQAILAAILADTGRIAGLVRETFTASALTISADERSVLAAQFQAETLKIAEALDAIGARVKALDNIDVESAPKIFSAMQEYAAAAGRLSAVARDFTQDAPLHGVA